MKVIIVALAMFAALTSSAQTLTFHVTTVRDWATTDPAPVSRAFKIQVVMGTLNGKRYTTQQIFSWGSQHFEVGADYPVAKSDAKSLTVIMLDKKGHEIKERLDVVAAEELGP